MVDFIPFERKRSEHPEDPLRILYAACGIVYRTGCGPSQHMVSLAQEIGKIPGVALTLLFAHAYDPLPTGSFQTELLSNQGISPTPGMETDSLVLGINPFRYIVHRRRVHAFAREATQKHDVLVERMWGYGGILAKNFLKTGKTVILEENGPITWQGRIKGPGDLLRLFYFRYAQYRLKRVYGFSRTLVVQTPNLAERLENEFEVPRGKLKIIPNGVNLKQFQSLPPSEKTSDRGPLILMYSGTLDQDHDLRPLLRAVVQQHGKIEVRILGSGPLKKDLDVMAQGPGGECIRLLGRVPPEEVRHHLSEAHLCLAPYSQGAIRPSGFQYSPLKIREYVAAGRPVVIAGAPCSDKTVIPDVNGFFIPNETSQWLKLFDRLPDKSELSRMGWKGKQNVNHLGWNEIAQSYIRLICDQFDQTVVAPSPFHNEENPYIERLHYHLRKHGVKLIDPGSLGLGWLFTYADTVDILHFHWPESHYQFPSKAYSLAKWFQLIVKLRVAQYLGYRIVWTVHNLEAHDSQLPYLDRWLKKHLLRRTGIILLGEASLPALKERFAMAPTQACEVIPHGHYIGCHGTQRNQMTCREALGLPRDAQIYLFAGTIRRYKGLESLVETFSRLKLPQAVLVVAGKVVDRKVMNRIQHLTEVDPERFVLLPGFISQEKMGCFLGACDFLVLPYTKVHMSGTLVLGLSYARPVIVPDIGLIREYLPHGAGILYDAGDPLGLEKALEKAANLDPISGGRKGLEFAKTLHWEEIAEKHGRFYSTLLRKRPKPFVPSHLSSSLKKNRRPSPPGKLKV